MLLRAPGAAPALLVMADYDAERHRDGGWNKFFTADRPLMPGQEGERFQKYRAHAKPPRPAPKLRGTPDEWFQRELRKFEAASRRDPSRATYDFVAASKKLRDLGLISPKQQQEYINIVTGAPRARADWQRRAKAVAARPPVAPDMRPWRTNMSATGSSFHNVSSVAPPTAMWAAPRDLHKVTTRDALFADAIAAAGAHDHRMPVPEPTIAARMRPSSAAPRRAAPLPGADDAIVTRKTRPQSASAARASRRTAPAPPVVDSTPYLTNGMGHENNWGCRKPGSTYNNWRSQ